MVMRFTDEGHVTVTSAGRTLRAAGRPTSRGELDPIRTIEAVCELGVRLDADERERLAARVATRQHERQQS